MRASSSLDEFRRGGYGLPQVGGGSVGGGVVGSAVGITFRSGDTPANDTRLLRPEKISTFLKKETQPALGYTKITKQQHAFFSLDIKRTFCFSFIT